MSGLRTSFSAALVAVASGSLILATSPASFADGGCSLAITPPSAAAGSWIMLHGTGLEPSSLAEAYLDSQELTSAKTNPNGDVLEYFKVPDGLSPGQTYPIYLTTGLGRCSAKFTAK